MIEEVELENSVKIKEILNQICRDIIDNSNKFKSASKSQQDDVYKSYDVPKDSQPRLTELLNNQSIFPLSYLVAVIKGDDSGDFPPHRDYWRHESILYLHTSQVCQTNWYETNSTTLLNRLYYTFDQITLKKSYYLEQGKFYKFDHQQVHDVKGVKDTRVSISINLSKVSGYPKLPNFASNQK
jgi:hypothetical protein